MTRGELNRLLDAAGPELEAMELTGRDSRDTRDDAGRRFERTALRRLQARRELRQLVCCCFKMRRD